VIVTHWDHDDEREWSQRSGCDLHGHIGAFDEVDPDDSRPRIGFRLREPLELVGNFPRGPALSWDGKRWEPL
jgi:hypothetical protein